MSDILNPPSSGTVSGRGDEGEYSEPGQRRCECGACEFEAGPMAWYWQPMQEKMLRRVHEYSHLRIYPNDCGFAHCPGECGCRLSVVAGEPAVGPSVAKLLAALALELSDHGDCPMDYSDWPCPAAPETHDCEGGPVELCWLLYYGLADTYAEAAVLWARMEEAAK